MAEQKNNWVNFTEIKKSITMEMVLSHYGIEMQHKGKGHYGACPIHKGTNKKQFTVSFEKNIWNCFGDCGTGGNVLDFVAMMEFGSKERNDIRNAGLKINEWFGLEQDQPAQPKKKAKTEKASIKPETKKETDPDKKNKPMDFQFEKLIPEHPWFDERGITRQAVDFFGLGLQEKGKTIPGRIAIPIHNEKNELVAYCGRAVNEEQIDEDGKYKLPGNFYKSLVLYNLNRQAPGQRILYVVESFISVWKLWQSGIPNVVALMGSSLSAEQKTLLLNYFQGRNGGIVLGLDPDKAGENGTRHCLYELSPHLYIKRLDLKEKLNRMTDEEIKALLS